jgi:hypothetical protein
MTVLSLSEERRIIAEFINQRCVEASGEWRAAWEDIIHFIEARNQPPWADDLEDEIFDALTPSRQPSR